MNLYEYITNNRNFSYLSNITHNSAKFMLPGAIISAIGSAAYNTFKPAGAPDIDLTGVGALISAGIGAGKGAIDEAVGRHKLKKAGYKMDKNGFIEIKDKDGFTHKVHLNSIKSPAANSSISKHNLKSMLGRAAARIQGADVPFGYKDDLVNINPWVVDYDKGKSKGIIMHEIGHKRDDRLKTPEGDLAYKKDTKPFEEYADRFAVRHGTSKKKLREAIHDVMKKTTDPLTKLFLGKKLEEKIEKADKSYRGDYLYRREKRKSKKKKKPEEVENKPDNSNSNEDKK